MYSRRDFLKGVGSVLAGTCLVGCRPLSHGAKNASRPNIILIMSDDMGFSDIGCYGSEISTPTLDGLAAEGLRFSQFYNTARCCPTRASLLTGLYQHQAGVGHMMSDDKLPAYRGNLNTHCMTIAEVMKGAKYRTYMAGKWHVTQHIKPDGDKHNWPRQRGFDRFFGTIHGAGSFYDPNSLTVDNTQIVPWKDFYYTEAISDYAVKYIKEHQTEDPFFMYVAYTAAHWPMHARPKDMAKYKGRYKDGWDALRKERHARLKTLGLVSADSTLTSRDSRIPAWEDEPNKPWQEARMETYAAMVDNMDQGIHRIVQSLKDQGKFENTLIFFLQDNGGCAEEYGSQGRIKPDPSKPVTLKPMQPGELQTRMQPQVTRDGRPVRTGKGVMPGPSDTYIAYGKGWANASNTPFRLYKHWVHEGGISTPLIVHWPEAVQKKGALCHQPSHLIDIMATCVDVSGASYPTQFKDQTIHPLAGKSLVPAFHNRPINREEGLFWEHEGNRAVRLGHWKLVSKYPGPWELYNIEQDRSETKDLSKQHPEVVGQLKAMYEAWAKRCQVMPWKALIQHRKDRR